MKYSLVHRKKSFIAKNNIEFVHKMLRHDNQYWKDNLEFMKGYAHRKLLFEKIQLRYDNENVFVEDLKKHELLIISKEMNLFSIFGRNKKKWL